MLSEGSWVQIPAGSTTRVFKKTDEIMLAVILNLVSIQMIVSSVCVWGGGGGGALTLTRWPRVFHSSFVR